MGSFDFEGWINCFGDANQFVQETDKELLKALDKVSTVDDFVGAILVCPKCVKESIELESDRWPEDSIEILGTTLRRN